MINTGVRISPRRGQHQLATPRDPVIELHRRGQVSQRTPVPQRRLQPVVEHVIDYSTQASCWEESDGPFPLCGGDLGVRPCHPARACHRRSRHSHWRLHRRRRCAGHAVAVRSSGPAPSSSGQSSRVRSTVAKPSGSPAGCAVLAAGEAAVAARELHQPYAQVLGNRLRPSRRELVVRLRADPDHHTIPEIAQRVVHREVQARGHVANSKLVRSPPSSVGSPNCAGSGVG